MDSAEAAEKIFDADLFPIRPLMDSAEKSLQTQEECSEEKKNPQLQEVSSIDLVEVVEKNLPESLPEKKNLQIQEDCLMDLVEVVEKNLQENLVDSVETVEKKDLQMEVESSMDSVEAVEKILNYSFENKSLIKDALKQHDVGTQRRSFKRLEFLGDSVLGLAITNYLHLTFPDLKDEELKELQIVNTSNDKFARVAVKRGLLPFVICITRKQTEKIKAFSEAVSKEDDLVWYQGSMEAPKILADFVEAIAGAVYIDVNSDIQRLWEILKGLLDPIFTPDDYRRRHQPVVTLRRLGKKRLVFKYCHEDETRTVAKVYFDDKFIASGHGKTGSRARIAAAKEALQKMSECMPEVFMELPKCRPIKKITHKPSLRVKKNIRKPSLQVRKNIANKKKFDKRRVDKGQGKVEVFYIQTRSCTRKLQLQKSLEEKKNLQIQECSEEEKNLQLQESLEERKNLQMQESLEEKKNLQLQESLEEKKNLQMQKSLEKKKNLQMQESSKEVFHIQTRSCTRKLQLQKSLEENKNLQMQESLEKKKSPQMDSVEAVEKILNYSFLNKSLLEEAITQQSGMKSRLEILGNTALRHAFTEYLYFEYPTLVTNGLAQLRNANKHSEKFARVAVKHGLGKFLILDRSLDPQFDANVKLFSRAVSKEDGPVPYGGLVLAPRILSALIESVVGAVYVDVNFHVRKLWKICEGLLEPFYTLDDLWLDSNPVLTLTQLGAKHGKQINFRYLTVSYRSSACEVYMDDAHIACGRSTSKDEAELVAAKAALVKLSKSKMVMETVTGNIKVEEAKENLIEICKKRKLPNPIYSAVAQDPVKGFGCSAEIETPTEEGTLFIKGDSRKKQKIAETVVGNTKIEEETSTEHTEIERAKNKLIDICRKRKWPKPIYSVVSEDRVKGFICAAEIKIPTEEGTFVIKGDCRKRKKQAEKNSAYHMINALELSFLHDGDLQSLY